MRTLVASAVLVVSMGWLTPAVAQPNAGALPAPVAHPGAAQPATAKSWLGVGIGPGLSGVLVSEVIPGTPALDAGLLAGDEIVAIAGKRVVSTAALTVDIGARAAGQQVELQVLRGRKRLRLPVVLDLLPTESEILQLRLGDRPAPPFSLPVVRGGSGRLTSYRGRVVVLMFWSSWDSTSKSLMLPLSKLAHSFGPRQLEVLAVSADVPATQRKFLATNKVPFTLLHDGRGVVRTRAYRTKSLPALIVIDRSGVVRYAGIGGGHNVDHAVFVAKRAARER
jgi:peroxiredoxin